MGAQEISFRDRRPNMKKILLFTIALLVTHGEAKTRPDGSRNECNLLCDVWYPHNWTGPMFTTTPCGPECPFCASGGTTPQPDSLVKLRCFEFPPPQLENI